MDERREALLDAVALLTAGSLICAGGVGLLLFLLRAFPGAMGLMDGPMGLGQVVLRLLEGVVVLGVGGGIGGVLWIVAMSRLLPKVTMRRCLTSEPRVEPFVSLSLKLLDRMYSGQDRGGNDT